MLNGGNQKKIESEVTWGIWKHACGFFLNWLKAPKLAIMNFKVNILWNVFTAEGKPFPTELRNEEAALRKEIELEDELTAGTSLLLFFNLIWTINIFGCSLPSPKNSYHLMKKMN